ncbi:MAG: hypothetical protein H7228_10800 [Polaromonas sp.]|nr:hypothetical protein [Polaromonas sp.]
MKYLFNRIVASTLVVLSPSFAMAQSWIPTNAITFVVPVTSGSSNDLIARMHSEELPAKLVQPGIVDNRPDTSDLVGAVSVARSAPDGHTIVMVPSDVYMAPILTPRADGANFDIIKDFSPIPTAGSAPMLIVASQSINVKTPQERAAHLKKSGATSYGSPGPGTGSPMNISGEMLKRYTGTQIHHVPFRGVLPPVNAVLAGELPICIVALAGEAPHIATRKPRHVGLIEKQRSELISTMPTMTESGIAGVETAEIFQILAPSATPEADIQRPNTDINAVLATSEFRDKLRGMGVQIAGGTSSDAAKLVRDTCAREQQVVKDLNITVECAKS